MAQNGGDGNNGGGAKKVEALQPHLVNEQLPRIQYCINSPPPWHLFLSPLSVVTFVTFTGLRLYHLGFPMYLPRYIESKQPICDRYAVLFSVAITWLFAQLLTSTSAYKQKPENTQISCRTDPAGLISIAPWIYIPYPFQWGNPTFNVAEAFVMIAPAFVSLFQSTGTFFAAARYGSATPVPPSVISRGTGWLRKCWPVGIDKSWKPQSDSNISWFYDFLLCICKIWSFFASIPLPVVAALYCVLFGFVSAAGLTILEIVIVIFMSHTTVAALVALFFDLTLSRENEETKTDSGLKWWEKFSLYKSDVRNDEFYALPC
ncbi:hypothetical protein REPUB_Repub05bG0133600 [Reevesia pubescens]